MCTESTPRISILVPSFNEALSTIRESLDAIRCQTFQDFECLVIDESTDPAKAEAIKDLCARDGRFYYIHPDSRLGLAASLNLGLQISKGEFIARCDSDDVCLPNRLELQVNYLERHPEIGVLGGFMQIINDNGQVTGLRTYPIEHTDIERSMMVTNAMGHPTIMFRRDLPNRFGGYDPAYKFSEDLELWLRWLNVGVKFANLPETLLKYRQQVTIRHPDHWRFNLMARKRHYNQHRLFIRTLGIIGVALWSKIPNLIQDRLFKLIIFKRK